MKIASFILLSIFWLACTKTDKAKEAEQKILVTEAEFEKAVKAKGIRGAFLEFADDSAVLSRSGKIYRAKKEIEEYYNHNSVKTVSLTWHPEFVKASGSGAMGYTYGRYYFSGEDSAGRIIKLDGIFHTVWKRQKDGSWKYLYD